MKTITEFSGTVLREAARIRRAHRPQKAPAAPAAAEEGAQEAAQEAVVEGAPAPAA
jgi:hypothetical protein